MPDELNFTVPAGNDLEVSLEVDAQAEDAIWSVFRMPYGVPEGDAVFMKTIGAGLESAYPASSGFVVTLEREDTVDLKGNYYHELCVVDSEGKYATPMVGIMTVTGLYVTGFPQGEMP